MGPTDVFPEQFEHFIVGKKHLKQELKALHGEIMTAEYWQHMQAQSLKGDVPDFIPYDQTKRFVN